MKLKTEKQYWIQKNQRNKALVLWKDQYNWQNCSMTDKEKKKEDTNYQYQECTRDITTDPVDMKKKRILQTLHTKIWQLQWNGPLSQETPTTTAHPIWNSNLNSPNNYQEN